MNSAASENGLVALLLALSAVRGQTHWAVLYSPSQICALEFSTVEIRAYFSYPQEVGGSALAMADQLWVISQENQQPADLRTLPQFAGRIEYSCEHKKCFLRIRELRMSDSAVYKFMFTADVETYTGEPGVTLTVTGLSVKQLKIYYRYQFRCESRCDLKDPSSYIWYKNNNVVVGQTSEELFSGTVYGSDTVTCAVDGLEAFPSPPVCPGTNSNCKRVTYPERNICAFKGSSVKMSCVYKNQETTKSVVWITLKHGGRKDYVYFEYNRVQVKKIDGISSTLLINNLKESDSAEYHCQLNYRDSPWRNSFPGTSLTVTDPDLQVQVFMSPTGPKLFCHSSCLQDRFPFIWYQNDSLIPGETSASYRRPAWSETNYSCGWLQYRSHPVYAPTDASVTVSPPGGSLQNSSVSLTCHADANPAAKYTWFRENQSKAFSEKQQLFLRSLQASDSGEYYCRAENQLGGKISERISVKLLYAPRFCSVSVSPSAEVEEATSVTLSCSCDANPAANYSWFKGNQTLLQKQEGIYYISSIRFEDTGIYRCRSENQYGEISCSVFMDVQYAPRFCSVSVSPSAEVKVNSLVTLSCSCDANPAANYSWFKEGEEAPKSSEQNFTITHVRAEDSGKYYCRVWNSRGRLTSSLHLAVTSDFNKLVSVGIASVAFVLLLPLAFILRYRIKKTFDMEWSKCRVPPQSRAQASPETTSAATQVQDQDQDEDGELHYASIHLRLADNDVVYSNITLVQPRRQRQEDKDDETEYSSVMTAARQRCPENGDDSSGLYSMLSKDLMNI